MAYQRTRKKYQGRGGARKNTGRPTRGELLSGEKERAATQVAFRLTPSEARRLEGLSKDGETLHTTCRRLALESLERDEKQDQASSALQRCVACGQMFDPWHKTRRCHICDQPV